MVQLLPKLCKSLCIVYHIRLTHYTNGAEDVYEYLTAASESNCSASHHNSVRKNVVQILRELLSCTDKVVVVIIIVYLSDVFETTARPLGDLMGHGFVHVSVRRAAVQSDGESVRVQLRGGRRVRLWQYRY